MTMSTNDTAALPQDENKLIAERRAKLAQLRAQGAPAFPNDFRRDALAGAVHAAHGALDAETLEARAIRVARRIRTGQVDINGAPFNSNAPFGGFKQSGHGRENGKFGLDEFLEYKSLQLKPTEK